MVYGGKEMASNVSHVRTVLLCNYHDSPYAGHLGTNKTLHIVHNM